MKMQALRPRTVGVTGIASTVADSRWNKARAGNAVDARRQPRQRRNDREAGREDRERK